MRRAYRIPLAALLTAVLAAGCGGGGGTGVAHATWTGRVCQALGPWRGQITALNAQAAQDTSAAKTPAQTRDGLLRLLSGAQQASEDARARVAAAGVPDVPDGPRIAARFTAALAAVRDAYAKAGRAVAALPLAQPKAFYDGVAAALATLNTEYGSAGVDTAKLASATLRRDFDEVPACSPG